MADTDMEHLDPVARAVWPLAEPVASDLGYELVDVQFRREQHGQVLRIVIYRPEGVSVDDCASVSRQVGHLLEVEDIIEQAYNLEVTSPGLDWKLKSRRDFERYLGKKIKVVLLDSPEPLIGLISEAGDDRVLVETDDGEVSIDLARIKRAALVIEF